MDGYLFVRNIGPADVQCLQDARDADPRIRYVAALSGQTAALVFLDDNPTVISETVTSVVVVRAGETSAEYAEELTVAGGGSLAALVQALRQACRSGVADVGQANGFAPDGTGLPAPPKKWAPVRTHERFVKAIARPGKKVELLNKLYTLPGFAGGAIVAAVSNVSGAGPPDYEILVELASDDAQDVTDGLTELTAWAQSVRDFAMTSTPRDQPPRP